ncbi:copper homeostasis protein CutC [Weissella soli]|uniref:copper homeostasis protein CutC n=1 Tax=Weissella soli TaxID=155866 RepID=UPI001F17AB01|nr:copper homeostasis protein CutC [Weissella soli]GJM47831.1 copper homeostasis protein CutC [Weissella soli]
MLREIALADLNTLQLAINAGIERVELNAHLELGGVTPTDETVQEAVRMTEAAGIDLVVMVRPRAGDFNYSYNEIEEMLQIIKRFRTLGVKTVTFGVLTANHCLARDKMFKLIEAAKPMQVVFHMAFDDIVPQKQGQALRWLARYGVIRVLTHGGPLSESIDETLPHLKIIKSLAQQDIEILPGGGVTHVNAHQIATSLAVNQVHGTHIIKM